MSQKNGMEKRNFTNSVRNGGKKAEMRNNSGKSRMVDMCEIIETASNRTNNRILSRSDIKTTQKVQVKATLGP